MNTEIYMKHEKYMNIEKEKEVIFSFFRLMWIFTYRSAQLLMITIVPF